MPSMRGLGASYPNPGETKPPADGFLHNKSGEGDAMDELPPHRPEQVRQSAGDFRDQATLCLEIARHISDPHAVESLRASAARHLIKADDVEKRSGTETDPSVPQRRNDQTSLMLLESRGLVANRR